MKFMPYTEAEATRYNNEKVQGVAARVVIGKADGAENFCMRVFEIASGGNTPKHTHDWEHEMFIHAGTGEIFCNGAWNAVQPGSVAFIPSGAEHQIRNAGAETLVVVCLVPAMAPEL